MLDALLYGSCQVERGALEERGIAGRAAGGMPQPLSGESNASGGASLALEAARRRGGLSQPHTDYAHPDQAKSDAGVDDAHAHLQPYHCSRLQAHQASSDASPLPSCRHACASLSPAHRDADVAQAAVTVVWGPRWGLCCRAAPRACSTQAGGERGGVSGGGGLGFSSSFGAAAVSREGVDRGIQGREDKVGGGRESREEEGGQRGRGYESQSVDGMRCSPQKREGMDGEGGGDGDAAMVGCEGRRCGGEGEEESLWLSVLRSELLVGAISHHNPLVRSPDRALPALLLLCWLCSASVGV